MGADAGEAYVALGVPARLGADDVARARRGHGGARRARTGTAIAGGDVDARARR